MSDNRREKVNLISKNNQWATWISKEEAKILVEEGVAVSPSGNSNVFKMLYTKTEIQEYIIKRDKNMCRMCQKDNHEIHLLKSQEENGRKTLVNQVCLCELCVKSLNKENVYKLKQENMHFLNAKRENLVCQSCKKEKKTEQLIQKGEDEYLCKKCIEHDKNLCLVYTSDEKITGVRKRDDIRTLIRKDEAVIRNNHSIYIVQKDKEKKCILCNNIKEIKQIKGKICDACLISKCKEGLVEVLTLTGNKKFYISIESSKNLIENGTADQITKNKIQLKNNYKALLFLIKRIPEKRFIVISRSGKWSMEATEKEAIELINDHLAEKIEHNTIRMTINIEEFKETIIKRDKRRCTFCGKKAHGVFSKSKIKTYSNSVCACIECEYELEPKKLLKWLNIKEQPKPILNVLKIQKDDSVWLYECSGKNKYKIKKEITEQLIKEEMAEKIEDTKAKLKYNAQTFREFIVERENKKCHYCGKKGKTVDHVIPKSKGGLTTPKNCVCACERCNTKKGNSDKKIFLNYLKQKKR